MMNTLTQKMLITGYMNLISSYCKSVIVTYFDTNVSFYHSSTVIIRAMNIFIITCSVKIFWQEAMPLYHAVEMDYITSKLSFVARMGDMIRNPRICMSIHRKSCLYAIRTWTILFMVHILNPCLAWICHFGVMTHFDPEP